MLQVVCLPICPRPYLFPIHFPNRCLVCVSLSTLNSLFLIQLLNRCLVCVSLSTLNSLFPIQLLNHCLVCVSLSTLNSLFPIQLPNHCLVCVSLSTLNSPFPIQLPNHCLVCVSLSTLNSLFLIQLPNRCLVCLPSLLLVIYPLGPCRVSALNHLFLIQPPNPCLVSIHPQSSLLLIISFTHWAPDAPCRLSACLLRSSLLLIQPPNPCLVCISALNPLCFSSFYLSTGPLVPHVGLFALHPLCFSFTLLGPHTHLYVCGTQSSVTFIQLIFTHWAPDSPSICTFMPLVPFAFNSVHLPAGPPRSHLSACLPSIFYFSPYTLTPPPPPPTCNIHRSSLLFIWVIYKCLNGSLRMIDFICSHFPRKITQRPKPA